ncbi:MAG TPA: hypothetical protein VGQ33_04585, partial [Vicinamibacteria bacterium]|nr:hypothetical protein [Vicinamibacteria bacterium]
TAPLLRAASGAEEWTRLLPGFVLDESTADRVRLTGVWTVALLAAAIAARPGRPGTPAALAAASLGLVAAAGIASRLSTARTEGRDAVRVVGRPALAVPGWAATAADVAWWTPVDLGWGPSYEPHRAPEGAVVGERLSLTPGPYLLTLEGEAVPSALPPPFLVSGPEGGPFVAAPMIPAPGRLSGSFVVGGNEATTLRLKSGAPFIVKDIRLQRASTFWPRAGLKK